MPSLVGDSDNLTHATVSAGLPCVTRGTDAHIGADQVFAGHASAGAVIYTVLTLILIWKTDTFLRVKTMQELENLCACTCIHAQDTGTNSFYRSSPLNQTYCTSICTFP